MGGYEDFYDGSKKLVSYKEGSSFFGGAYTSQISLPSDPRTANQIKSVNERINMGAKAIEVSMLFPDKIESIPNQHLDELNKLRKLTGVDFTVHGPLIDPTGIGSQEGEQKWDPLQRKFAEEKITSVVERAKRVMGDKENVIVTIHASNGLPEPETKIIQDGEPIVKGLGVIDPRSGRFGTIPAPPEDYLSGDKKGDPYAELRRINRESWLDSLSQISVELMRTHEIFDKSEKGDEQNKKLKGLDIEEMKKTDLSPQTKEDINVLGKNKEKLETNDAYARAVSRDAYQNLNKLFNQAYYSADEEDKKKLDEYKSKVGKIVKEYNNDSGKVNPYELYETVKEGVKVLNDIKEPQILKPIKQFAIEQASETFSNVAINTYGKDGKNAPILSIENPPAGSGINRAEDLKDLIEASRKKLADKLVDKKGLSKSEAEAESKKLIGATWDVGHINMIRKFGYGDKDLRKEAEKIAPFVKHIHLSDNFGLDHTEIPMGMGNVPMNAHLEELRKVHQDKLKQIKMVSETGNWFEPFGTVPFVETLQAFGSPIYGMNMSPYWNQSVARGPGNYFSGYGTTLPDQHFSMYGAGFSSLPTELGGQMSGRSRMSGNPME